MRLPRKTNRGHVMTVQQLGIDRMTVGERIMLVQEILATVAAEQRPTLSEAKRRDLDRRLADIEANPADIVPCDAIFARV